MEWRSPIIHTAIIARHFIPELMWEPVISAGRIHSYQAQGIAGCSPLHRCPFLQILQDSFVVSRPQVASHRNSCTTQVRSLVMLELLISCAHHAPHQAYLPSRHPSSFTPHPVICSLALYMLSDNKVGPTNGDQRGADGLLDVRTRGGTHARGVRVSAKGQTLLQVRGHQHPSLDTEYKRAHVIEGNKRREKREGVRLKGARGYRHTALCCYMICTLSRDELSRDSTQDSFAR